MSNPSNIKNDDIQRAVKNATEAAKSTAKNAKDYVVTNYPSVKAKVQAFIADKSPLAKKQKIGLAVVAVALIGFGVYPSVSGPGATELVNCGSVYSTASGFVTGSQRDTFFKAGGILNDMAIAKIGEPKVVEMQRQILAEYKARAESNPVKFKNNIISELTNTCVPLFTSSLK